MTYEAVLRNRIGDPIDFEAEGDDMGVEKGQFLRLLDERQVTGAATVGAACAGICAREKIAGDGRTNISVYQSGIFDVYCSGAIAIGNDVQMAEDNHVKVALAASSGAITLGRALEVGSTGEVMQIKLTL